MCARPEGQCRGEGICRQQPAVADCPFVYDPVCGCDGGTYGNPCRAAVAGTNVANHGPCPPSPICEFNTDCPDTSYCAKPNGDCDGPGLCVPRPVEIEIVYALVCGCNGRTFTNQSIAALFGVNVRHVGACPTVCLPGTPCDDGNPCTLEDTCVDGVCVGCPTDEADTNCDGVVDRRDTPPDGLLGALNHMASFGVVTVDENCNVVIVPLPRPSGP